MSTADSWSTIRLHHLRDLLAVVETGSLRAAARKLGLTQPSLTKSLRQLEEQTALALLVRSKHGVTLTSAGQHLVERARLIESELRRTAEDLDLLRGGTVRSVSVGVSPRRTARCAPASFTASAVVSTRHQGRCSRAWSAATIAPVIHSPTQNGQSRPAVYRHQDGSARWRA